MNDLNLEETISGLDGDFFNPGEQTAVMRQNKERYEAADTYESSEKSVIWILAMRARISIRWRPSSVCSPLMRKRKRRKRK